MTDNEKGEMPFLDHLDQLRWRLLKSIIAIVSMSLLAFYFSDELFQLIIKPLGDIKLHVTDVTGRISSSSLSRNKGRITVGDGGQASRLDTSNGSIHFRIAG